MSKTIEERDPFALARDGHGAKAQDVTDSILTLDAQRVRLREEFCRAQQEADELRDSIPDEVRDVSVKTPAHGSCHSEAQIRSWAERRRLANERAGAAHGAAWAEYLMRLAEEAEQRLMAEHREKTRRLRAAEDAIGYTPLAQQVQELGARLRAVEAKMKTTRATTFAGICAQIQVIMELLDIDDDDDLAPWFETILAGVRARPAA
jgi:hypothetical protein